MAQEFLSSCMCRSVVSLWEVEYPFVRQGVMHSPVGCIRRDMSKIELKALYRELSGFEIENDDIMPLFQAVMFQFTLHPEVAVKFPVVLTPVSTLTHVEKPSPVKEKREGRTSVGGASKPPPAKRQDVVVNPGPIPPPWLKKP